MRLSFVAVTTVEQFTALLVVRNECRDGLTNTTTEITLKQQKAFMSKCWMWTGTTWYEPYLLYDADWPVGYGLLYWDGEKYWMTAGVVQGERGKGLSRLLINFITEMGHREGHEVVIDVYDNNAALFGDIRAGYEFTSEPGADKHQMKHSRDRRLGDRELDWLRARGRDA